MKKIIIIFLLVMCLSSCYSPKEESKLYDYDKGYSTNDRRYNFGESNPYELLKYEINTVEKYNYDEEIDITFKISEIVDNLIVSNSIECKLMPNENFTVIGNDIATINVNELNTVNFKVKAIKESSVEKLRICLKFRVTEDINLNDYYEVDIDEEYFLKLLFIL